LLGSVVLYAVQAAYSSDLAKAAENVAFFYIPFGLLFVLLREVRWTREGIAVKSWDDYPILGFAEIPEIEVVLLNHPELPGLGTGECAAGPTGAAIANALHDALGVRARHLPLTPERIAREM